MRGSDEDEWDGSEETDLEHERQITILVVAALVAVAVVLIATLFMGMQFVQPLDPV